MRYVYFAMGLPHRAALLDFCWLAVSVAFFSLISLFGIRSLEAVVLSWSFGGGVAWLLDMTFRSHRPAMERGLAQIRECWGLGRHYLVEFIATGGSAYLALLLLSMFVPDSTIGSVKGAQSLFGPLVVIYAGIYPVIIPRLARAGATMRDIRRASWILSVTTVASSIVWTLGLLLLPTVLGEGLLGGTWASADLLIPYTGLYFIGSAVGAGAIVALRSLRQQRLVTWIRLMLMPAILGAPLLAAFLSGVEAYLLVWALLSTATSIAFWVVLRKYERMPRPVVSGQ
jgi:hypothetical protein